ncbi:hypothetical protein FEE96_17130 [Parasedimentitalea maritima]|uniref:Sulfotransferase family protein n=1 Tax=Parasedimentitalea maritima TaxID=2578117 RepID=A0ABY2URY9_9RHOB|nr:hypothetical protein FEE96_17130 [Zongyanglinia marina]
MLSFLSNKMLTSSGGPVLPQASFRIADDPTNQSQLDHATALMQVGQHRQAFVQLQPLVKADPMNPSLLEAVSDCYWLMGTTGQSMVVLNTIADIWPDNVAIWGKLGARNLALGDKSAAETAFERMLALTPDSALALAALNLIKTFAPDSPRAQKLRLLAADTSLSIEETTGVINALGQIESSAGNTKEAFCYFQQAKDATPGEYAPNEIDAKVADQCQAFDPKTTPEAASECAEPRFAFVVGLPRSGTTLLTAMLSRHARVSSNGESPSLIDTKLALKQIVQQDFPSTGHWQWCQHASPSLLAAARQTFRKKNLPESVEHLSVVVEKLPQNAFEMGFARMMLPDAKFIFMARHPLDVGLSLFTNGFATGHAYTKQLEWIGHMIHASYASLEDYQLKLGSRLRIQSYRALVQSPEPQMKEITDHLGLDWDQSCLSPQHSEDALKTASVLQVREGINQKGIGKWKRFETELAPLIEALGGWHWIRAWEEEDAA